MLNTNANFWNNSRAKSNVVDTVEFSSFARARPALLHFPTLAGKQVAELGRMPYNEHLWRG
jgi:hypothetical protein